MKLAIRIRTRTAYPPLRTQFAQRLWCPSPGWTPCYAMRNVQARHATQCAMRNVQARRATALQPVRTPECPPDNRKLRALLGRRRYRTHELAQFEADLILLMASLGLPPQDLTTRPTFPRNVRRAKRRWLKELQDICQEIREELALIENELIAEWANISPAATA